MARNLPTVVKQKCPVTVEKAVSSTLEMEAILSTSMLPKPLRIAGVVESTCLDDPSPIVTAATAREKPDATLE